MYDKKATVYDKDSSSKEPVIRIEYDGGYPNLCSGELIVYIDDKKYVFGRCLSSGGGVSFDADWSEHVSSGPWTIHTWPEGFPEAMKVYVERAVNYEIPSGCCGGCV